MQWNDHSKLNGAHAFLSASKYHWLNYDEDKLRSWFMTQQAAALGTQLHDFASRCIKLNQKLVNNKATLNRFVNDAIGYRMESEKVLFYSVNCFGTADAISFKKNKLRIHDLKTGVSPASMKQLEIYAALFCLEYGMKPGMIDMELRIYQNDDVEIYMPDPDDIAHIMSKIVSYDKIIESMKEE